MNGSSTPAWISVATSGVLAVLTGLYVWQTWKLTRIAERQRAAAEADRRIERVKVARILTEETKRLRAALGEPDLRVADVRDAGVAFAVPAVHEWVRAIVPEGALISADVVGGFLTLERELNRVRVLQEPLKQDAYIAALARANLEPGAPSKPLQDLITRHKSTGAEFLEALNSCLGVLDDLDAQLRPVAREETAPHL